MAKEESLDMEAMDEDDFDEESNALAMDIELEVDEENSAANFPSKSPSQDPDEPSASSCLLACGGRDEFPMPLFENGRYQNPWGGSFTRPSMMNSFKHFFCSKHDCKMPKKCELEKTLPIVKPDLTEFETSPLSGVRHMWIGQSTSLIQFDGVTVLTDPMFSERCSPLPLVGYKRYRQTPCSISELPHIDMVLISHSHYDHLDYASVMALNQRYGDCLQWYVPQGLTKWMRDCGIANVVEMTWWQEEVFSEDMEVRIVCTPCQHWGKRTTRDENKVLWCSWCVIGPRHSFFFTGDTAYCDVFKTIGKHFGPFTLSTIPIGAYSPRSTMCNSHVDPEHAVKIHHDVLSQASIAIHWGTFSISNEPYLEPKQRLEQEIEKRGMKPSDFFTVKHGEIMVVGDDGYNDVD